MSKTISEKLAKWFSNVMHFGAAIGFSVYVVLEMIEASSPRLILLGTVAAMEFIGVLLDKAKENRDAAEAKDLRAKLDATAETTKDLKASRMLSDDVRELLKNRLSAFKGQAFRVFQIGIYDDEARRFAQQIMSALKDCGWIATDNVMCLQSSESRIAMRWGVACYAIQEAKTAEELIANPTMNVMGRLCIAFLDAGIAWGGSQRSLAWMPPPGDLIEVHVGEKPPPHYIAPSAP